MTVTPAAIEEIKKFFAGEEDLPETSGLRVRVVPGGCSGFQYSLNIEEESRQGDFILDKDGVKLFVDMFSAQYLNGINVGDPAAIGAAGFYYDFDAFEDIQVSTGAHDITVPTSGVFLNMVTKSGSDAWRGRGTFAWLGDATQTQNIDDELRRLGFRPESNSVDFVSDVNVSGGGPLIERKLRMFASGSRTSRTRPKRGTRRWKPMCRPRAKNLLMSK